MLDFVLHSIPSCSYTSSLCELTSVQHYIKEQNEPVREKPSARTSIFLAFTFSGFESIRRFEAMLDSFRVLVVWRQIA
jgi:hypothetical protein